MVLRRRCVPAPSLTLSLSRANTLSLPHTHTHTLSLSHTLSLPHKHTLTLPHKQTHPHTLSIQELDGIEAGLRAHDIIYFRCTAIHQARPHLVVYYCQLED